jgi:gamma-glutamyltranspeptidase / glutathione hydrolase / leukotriene-C4 hydrolase
MLVRTKTGESRAFDFRETAPSSSKPDIFKLDPSLSKKSGTSVAIPGEIRGFYDAHLKYGRLPWSELFDPNIKLAEEGFLITKTLYNMIKKLKHILCDFPAMRETYLDTFGNPKPIGHKLTRPALAETLKSISLGGPDVFYSGYICDALVQEINRHGGNVTKKDFEEYRTVESEPIQGTYRDLNLITIGAPASGHVLIEALNILDGYDLRLLNESGKKLEVFHIIVETMKLAYASRMKLGDPGFVNIQEILEKFKNSNWADILRTNISKHDTFGPQFYLDKISDIGDHGTAHVSVLDSDGMAVSCTSTINMEFGSNILDSRTGILLNNQMDNFSIPGIPNQYSIPPSTINYPEPGKRPVSSAIPVIFEKNGEVRMIYGGTGGSRIISSVLLALINVVDLDLSPISAVLFPRFHHQLIPNKLLCENEFDENIIIGLKEIGHEVNVLDSGFYYSSVQIIEKDTQAGMIYAAADPRKDGGVSGY